MAKKSKKAGVQMNMNMEAAISEVSEDTIAALTANLADIIEEEQVEAKAETASDEDAELLAIAAEIEAAEVETEEVKMAPEEEAFHSAESTEPKPQIAAKKAKKEKVAKAPRATSVTHKPGDLLLAKLGENASDFLVFTRQDATLEESERKAKIDAFIGRMNVMLQTEEGYIADKVKDKALQLFGWMKYGGALNEVMRRAFTVLTKEGKLTSGNKGNLQTNLLAKPYSPGTAASQANQMFMLFPLLEITKREKGVMVANPDSLILMKAQAELGLLAE